MSTFDTLAAARELEAAGIERPQAEAIAKTVRDGQGGLATKGDLDAGLAAVKSDIATLKWLAGIQIAISLAGVSGVLFLATRPIP